MAVPIEEIQKGLAQLIACHLFHCRWSIARWGGLLRHDSADVVTIAVV
jgi:hypothetical protein